MRAIIRAMLASPVPVLGFVAPGGARAASAGTYILYATALAAMAPGTNLGAATPVSLFGPTPLPVTPRKPKPPAKPGPPPNAELVKITNDAVAYIRGLATLHGRNADWAEKAVREAVSLPYDAALEQHVIDLVADDVPDLLAKAERPHGRRRRQDRAARHRRAGSRPGRARPARPPARRADQRPRRRLPAAAGRRWPASPSKPSHPGIYAPGVLGAICLLLGGYGLNLLPIDYAGLALVLLGVGLMVAGGFRALVRRLRARRRGLLRDRLADDVRDAGPAIAARR